MMNIAYASFPTRYADELRNKGQRSKARAFWEYHYDIEKGEHNAVRFYAKSWDVGTGTAHSWIDDFKKQIDLYHDAWFFRNKQHYSSVKKQSEHSEHSESNTPNTNLSQNIGSLSVVSEHSEHDHPNKALNLNNNNNTANAFWESPEFNDLFFIYGVNTKYKGKKEDAFNVFKNITVDVSLLKLAAVQYLHDPDTEGKRYNLTNFLKNEIYLSYMPKMLKIYINNEWLSGNYDDKTTMFHGDNGFVGQLSASRLVELYKERKLEFINPAQKIA